jgi:murein DD-endopeptidase MepM/ murein hydrolase activator NlpD
MAGSLLIFLAVFCNQMRFSNAAPVVSTDGKAIVLDLSTGSRLRGEAIANLEAEHLGRLIDETMADARTGFAFGRYAEPRDLYNNEHFADGDAENRTVHLGLDLFCVAGTPVFAPLDGKVELLANNARKLDYGPLIVLRHASDSDEPFFTLYGHLGMEVLDRLRAGQAINAGQQIATIGSPPQNGDWPPHLHFQLILDLKDLGVDFPGVACKSQQDYWLGLSPSPAAFFPECAPEALEYS